MTSRGLNIESFPVFDFCITFLHYLLIESHKEKHGGKHEGKHGGKHKGKHEEKHEEKHEGEHEGRLIESFGREL